jgi:tRNA (cmo5U34)-methyltransferase
MEVGSLRVLDREPRGLRISGDKQLPAPLRRISFRWPRYVPMYVITYAAVSDSVSVFAEHAQDYDGQRRRLVPCFESFYGTAVDVLALREGPVGRVLDLGAGTGLMSEAVLDRYPQAELVLLDGAAEMLAQAAERLRGKRATRVHADLREALPDGPFDAVVSALAIHHLEHADVRGLLGRIHAVLRPGGVFVNAEHVTGSSPWLEGVYRRLWRQACLGAGALAEEIAGAEQRMEMDRSSDIVRQLGWMGAAGFVDSDCFFKQLHFAVLAGWRS